MKPYRVLTWGVMASLLLLATACGTTVAPGEMAGATLSPTSGVEATAAVPTAPTNLPPTLAAATATSQPPTETVPRPTRTPSPTPPAASPANADVLQVRAVQSNDGSWTFHVTVEHPDTGWEDYADGWDVVTPDGTAIKPDPDSPFTRLLLHPHENEQPFTRSQSGIVIPAEVTQVRVRAHDLVAGFGGREVVVDLTAAKGEGFEVERVP